MNIQINSADFAFIDGGYQRLAQIMRILSDYYQQQADRQRDALLALPRPGQVIRYPAINDPITGAPFASGNV